MPATSGALWKNGPGKVPRHDLFDVELAPQLRVEIPLQFPEGRVGRGGEIFHDPGQLSGLDLLQLQRAGVVVLVPLLAGEPVPEPGQLPYGTLDRAADRLRSLPRLPAQTLIFGGSQQLPDLVLDQFLATDHAPVVAVDGVGLGLQLFDAAEGLLVPLTLLEHPVQDLDPASQERTLHGFQVLEKVTELPVLVRIGEQIAIRLASGHELFPRLVRARGRQVPPGLVRGPLHGCQTFLEVRDKALQIGGANHETAPSRLVGQRRAALSRRLPR